MYSSQGFSAMEIGDHDVIEHDGRLHLFHLTLPNHDLVAHVVSDDGLTWKRLPHALHTGEPGDCDDDMIGTMHTVRRPDRHGWYMYYTGCAVAERGNVQRVAMASSDDLIHWRKHPDNPILESRGPHYNDQFGLVGIISFRDPFVFIEDGRWHMLVTGRTSTGPRFRRGCIVHAESDDGVNWALQPPLYAPGQFEDMEVAAILKLEGHWYLFFHDFASHTLYRIADSLDGPWRAPQRDMLLPDKHFVFRFCRWGSRTLLLHHTAGECDWERRQSNAGSRIVAPPKHVDVQPDGELALRSYDGWRDYHTGQVCTFPGRRESARVHGQSLITHQAGTSHFVLETEVRLDEGRVLGLLLRADDDVDTANWLRLDYAQQRIELHKHVPFDSALNRWKLCKTLVESAPAKLEHGRPIQLRILACNYYIEVSLDDVVYLAAVTWAAQGERIGTFIEDGAGEIDSLRLQPLRAPVTEEPARQ